MTPITAAATEDPEFSEEHVRSVVLRCAERFDLLASITADEGRNGDPLDAARYIVTASEDLAADLALLRIAVQHRYTTA